MYRLDASVSAASLARAAASLARFAFLSRLRQNMQRPTTLPASATASPTARRGRMIREVFNRRTKVQHAQCSQCHLRTCATRMHSLTTPPAAALGTEVQPTITPAIPGGSFVTAWQVSGEVTAGSLVQVAHAASVHTRSDALLGTSRRHDACSHTEPNCTQPEPTVTAAERQERTRVS